MVELQKQQSEARINLICGGSTAEQLVASQRRVIRITLLRLHLDALDGNSG
jgi:hypothetical protein